MSEPIHHQSKRKRIHQKHEQYPHPHKFKRFIDRAVFIIGVLGPIAGSTQVYKIFTQKTAAGVSIILFGFGIVVDITWLTYGIVHKEKPIILTYFLWLLVNIAVVAGIVIYG